MLSFFEAKKGK